MLDTNLTFVTRKDENGKFLPFENRRKVFISYKKSDNLEGIRDRIVGYALASFDCAVWYDDSLTPGVDYDKEISEAIKESDVVILLLTKNILESNYVWDIEIKQAFREKKGIIPVLLGLGKESLCEIEKRLGHLQLLDGNYLLDSQTPNDVKEKFIDDLRRAIHQFLLTQDLVMCVSSFFAANKHLVPAKALSVEQLYYMSFGFLNGLGIDMDKSEAVEIMQSLLNLYTKDAETDELKAEITATLIKHYVNIGDFENAKALIGEIDRYGYAPLYYYVGSLFENILENNPERAAEYYQKGADLGHLESINAIAKLYLRWQGKSESERYATALPYLEKACEIGGEREAISLAVQEWNCGADNGKKAVCDLLAEDKNTVEFLNSVINSQSYLRTFTVYEHSEITSEEKLGEIELGGHKFYLYREKIDEKHNEMFLMRDDKVIYEFCCWAYGFGDIDSFDLREEGGRIIVECAEFCHYDRESNLSEYVFLNPLSKSILACNHNFDTKPGRILLKYPAY